jgi:hypothetical protein
MAQTPLKPATSVAGQINNALLAIWQRIRANRIAPTREEITLGMVRGLSSHFWLIDVIDGGADFRFRLTGDRIVQFLDNNPTGKLLSQLKDGTFRQRMMAAFSHSVQTRQPVAIGPAPLDYIGKDYWEIEAVVLPLSQDGETVTCLMGTVEFRQTVSCSRSDSVSDMANPILSV